MTKVSTAALEELVGRIGAIVNAGDVACLNGTPMIPLHKDTVAGLHSAAAEVVALRKALAELIPRFVRCCEHSGTSPEYAELAVEKYRAILSPRGSQS